MGKRWSSQEVKFLKRNYGGIPNKDIASRLNRTVGTVKTKAFELGLSTSQCSHYKNDEFFHEINNEIQAYILGFLFADGYVSANYQLYLELNMKDETLLSKIKNYIAPSVPLRHRIRTVAGKVHPSVYLSVNSKTICEQLRILGMDNKRKVRNLPREMEHHFIRGLFDGDGCLSYNVDKAGGTNHRWLLLGKYSLLKWVQEILMKNCGLNKNKLYRKSGIWCLEYGGNRQVKRIMDFLYQDATIYLQRKLNEFPIDRNQYAVSQIERITVNHSG